MKEIKEEVDRLVELYIQKVQIEMEIDRSRTMQRIPLSTKEAIQCAIIDVTNTIADNERLFKWAKDKKATEDILHGINGNIGWHKQVKQELESRLNK